jgi:hypothetical protein
LPRREKARLGLAADQFRFRWSKETLDVFQDNEERFQLDRARGFTLDLTARLALRDERPLASFDEIESFVLEVHEGADVGDTYRLVPRLPCAARCAASSPPPGPRMLA